MKIYIKMEVKSFKKLVNFVIVEFQIVDGKMESLIVEWVILVVGIVGNVENIGFEEVGIEVECVYVKIDQWCKISIDGIYVIGDLVGVFWLVYKVMYEGVLCVEYIVGEVGVELLYIENVLGCIYCFF